MWPSKERDAWMESNSSTKMVKKPEEEKIKNTTEITDEDLASISMVYALPQSFKAESDEYEETVYDGEKLTSKQKNTVNKSKNEIINDNNIMDR